VTVDEIIKKVKKHYNREWWEKWWDSNVQGCPDTDEFDTKEDRIKEELRLTGEISTLDDLVEFLQLMEDDEAVRVLIELLTDK